MEYFNVRKVEFSDDDMKPFKREQYESDYGLQKPFMSREMGMEDAISTLETYISALKPYKELEKCAVDLLRELKRP